MRFCVGHANVSALRPRVAIGRIEARRPASRTRASRRVGGAAFVGALVAALAVAGCKDDVECRLPSDCALPLTCIAGRCVPECRADRDCAPSEQCINGSCAPAADPPRLCAGAGGCRAGETCQGGVCQPVGLFPQPVDAGLARADAQPGALDATTGTPDAGGVGGDAGASGQPYGAVCMRASECASGLCLGPTGGAQGRCSKACAANGDCAFPDTCVEVAGAGRLCGSTQPGGQTGAACPNGPNDCASGLCLSPQGVTPFCTQLCAPLPTCPSGLACVPVADGAGGALTVCGLGNGRGFGEACSAASQCAANLCLGVGGAAQGLCTARCDQGVPCPSGYTCAAVDDGAGGSVGICAPSGAVGGGFGAACTGAASCQSGLCLSDARTGQAFCTIACASSAECAARPGSTCVVLADGSQVCGP